MLERAKSGVLITDDEDEMDMAHGGTSGEDLTGFHHDNRLALSKKGEGMSNGLPMLVSPTEFSRALDSLMGGTQPDITPMAEGNIAPTINPLELQAPNTPRRSRGGRKGGLGV